LGEDASGHVPCVSLRRSGFVRPLAGAVPSGLLPACAKALSGAVTGLPPT
jgi:hypothetical protein